MNAFAIRRCLLKGPFGLVQPDFYSSPVSFGLENVSHWFSKQRRFLSSSAQIDDDDPDAPLPGPVVPPVDRWNPRQAKLLFAQLNALRTPINENNMTQTEASLVGCLREVYNPILTPVKNGKNRETFWLPFRNAEKNISQFFEEWLYYAPKPDGNKTPGLYAEEWDYLANTKEGLKLTNENEPFKKWFVDFLYLRGTWIKSNLSSASLRQWMVYQGEAGHPFNISDYIVPDPKAPGGGFKSFNQFFLR